MNHSNQASQQIGDTSAIDLQFLDPDPEQKEDNWLSDQFNKTPYVVFKYCLMLTFILALARELVVILNEFGNAKKDQIGGLSILGVSCIFVLICCGEMLLAMTKRKSEYVHKSLIKLPYTLAGTLLGLIILFGKKFDFNGSLILQIFAIGALPAGIAVCIFGGSAVLGVFKQNNSLSRLKELHQRDEITRDYLNQNAVIMHELLNFDQQLSSCPYIVYKIWFKIVILLEILFFSLGFFYQIIPDGEVQEIGQVLTTSYLLMTCLWTVFCCYEVELILRTKRLEKSKKVLLYLKINIFMLGFPLVIALMASGKDFVKYLSAFLIPVLIPVTVYIGAFHVNKIIEQRDQFAKASCYSEDHYL